MKKYVFMTLASIALAMPVNAQFFHGLVEKAVEKQVEKKVAEKVSPKSANQSGSDQEDKSYIETDLQNIVAGGFEAKEPKQHTLTKALWRGSREHWTTVLPNK